MNHYKRWYMNIIIILITVVSLCMTIGFGESWIAFTSDTHNAGSKVSDTECSAFRLNNWLNTVAASNGCTFDYLCINGDIGTTAKKEAAYWSCVDVVIQAADQNSKVGRMVLITGNHEYQNGSYENADNDQTARFSPVGTVYEEDAYLIYCFGATSSNSQFTASAISDLEAFLMTAPINKQIFIISHYPLHSYMHPISNAEKVINLLNRYSSFLDISFLWGHNHAYADPKYDQVFTNDIDGKAIHFTYAAAGCMSDTEFSTNSGMVKGKGLIAHVTDQDFSLTYYDKNGREMTSYSKTKPIGLVQFDQNEYILFTEEGANLCKVGIKAKSLNGLQFFTKDQTIATIDENGIVTAHSVGSTDIVAVTEEGLKAEAGITVLSDPILHVSANTIEDNAFSGNESIRYILLEEGVDTIGKEAFSDCVNASLIHIPGSVTSIAEDAFAGSEKLKFLCPTDGVAHSYAISHGIPYQIY